MNKLMVAVVAGAMALGVQAATVYTGVDYIKATRLQSSLPTGYYPNPKTWMEISLQFSGDFQLSGTRPAGTGGTIFSATANAANVTYSANFGGDANQNNELFVWAEKNSAGVTSDKYKSFKFNLNNTVKKQNTLKFVNGSLSWGSESMSPLTKTTTCTNPLYILGTETSPFGAYEMTVWSWKIYESDNGKKGGPNEVLVHDYVPAKDANGVPGLYDQVEG